MLPELVIATHNAGKLKEFRHLLAPYVKTITSAGELGLPAPDETGTSFTENALIKARAACQASGKAALADDSGLCITALNEAPGVDTAGWVKDGGLEKLGAALKDAIDLSARSICVLALVRPDGREDVFEGVVEGAIALPPRGDGGFGYDAAFQPAGESQTYAEMGLEKKSTLSHRHRAFEQLVMLLNPLKD